MRFPNIRDKDGHKFLDGTERKDNQINIGNTERKKTVIKQGILDMQEPIYIYIYCHPCTLSVHLTDVVKKN